MLGALQTTLFTKVQDHPAELKQCLGRTFTNKVKFGKDGKLVHLHTIAKRNQSTHNLELDAYICLQKHSLDHYVKVQDHPVERN